MCWFPFPRSDKTWKNEQDPENWRKKEKRAKRGRERERKVFKLRLRRDQAAQNGYEQEEREGERGREKMATKMVE